jgi:hypothetical protein
MNRQGLIFPPVTFIPAAWTVRMARSLPVFGEIACLTSKARRRLMGVRLLTYCLSGQAGPKRRTKRL